MLTKNEITTLNLSPTKKDFVQIWNELLEVAGKLSERWDPTSTNESDPGIVILKALTGIADKLNYNIDKNTLEAFMPTAAQEDSMRKLCDMLGYNVKYYRSAETTVTIKYYNSDPSTDEEGVMSYLGLLIPKFTVISNSDQDINYFTVEQSPYISSSNPSVSVKCMEGQIVKCESLADNNVITASQISDNNRFYLPEYQIAENGIFVYNVAANADDGTPWKKVDNLNVQSRGSRVFKFGYDSYESRPYIEFPNDYSELLNDGLFIYYARTSGTSGNVSARTLTQLELPSADGWDKVSAESFSVENAFAATSGSNIESISQAYNSFKKTVGTFETLVTCRDYMNKIYTMIDDETGKPLVSNILATDIRTDINRAVTICSCDDAGIFYKDTPLTTTVTKTLKLKNPTAEESEAEVIEDEAAINHFDLVLYPFKTYNQIRGNVKDIQEVYDASFRYNTQSFDIVKSMLDESDVKTIAHNIIPPREGDVLSINNYLRLNAIIGTNSKITEEEGALLKENIKIALANAFNMHELDFGEEIPFESIVEVIENADTRIKIVSLAEPALYTTFSVLDSYNRDRSPVVLEYAVASEWLDADTTNRFDYGNKHTFDTQEAKKIYNKLALRNVLAGRVPLFKYNNTFTTSFSEGAYRVTDQLDTKPDNLATPTSENPFTIWTDGVIVYTGQLVNTERNEIVYKKTYVPDRYITNIITKGADDNNITEITTSCKICADKDEHDNYTNEISNVTLENGEFIKFRAPNLITKKTFPAYVNYHLDLTTDRTLDPEYATAHALYDLLNDPSKADRGLSVDERRQKVLDYFTKAGLKKTFTLVQKVAKKNDEQGGTASTQKDGDFILNIENPTAVALSTTPEDILANSGFVKISSTAATLLWDNPEGIAVVEGDGPKLAMPELSLGDTSFIVDATVFTNIQVAVDNYLQQLNDNSPNKLPTECDWTISYKFEYVPFEEASLATWVNFIKHRGSELFGFKPIEEHGTILWRTYSGGYSAGKYILPDTSKLMAFTGGYFGLLESLTSRLAGIYITEDLGRDVKASIIGNNDEYMLRENEHLYIEYTPSSTTEDGTTQEQKPVKEIFGAGTIIRPTGFEGGLMESSEYALAGHSPHKEVVFETSPSTTLLVPLHSLGANEQIEIRDFAQVKLNRTTLPSANNIYVYKNFNNCPALETIPTDGYDEGHRVNSSYTLKDGEYIFYTDQNKAEFAYFTSGTEVTLTGSTTLPKFDIIDIAAIFDNGIQEIPWKPLRLAAEDDGIIFTEFQYVTLGAGDKLQKLLLDEPTEYLDAQWQTCSEASYIPAGTTTSSDLPRINISDTGGWEVCSVLELNTAPNNKQTLRAADKVTTSITLHKESASGVAAEGETTEIIATNGYPLSFKTNLACQSSSGQLKLADLYTNQNKLKSFELKVFAEEYPSIIKTKQDCLIPYGDGTLGTGTMWPIIKTFETDGFGTIWQSVLFSDLMPDDEEDCDRALKLSVTTLPDTYGIFSIYINYRNSSNADTRTWIELLPGASLKDTVTLLNVDEKQITWEGPDTNLKLILKPGINCIRVNKTSDLFIKTNATDGVLYFDNIRLVDCQPVEYINEDGTRVTQKTCGLNLSQIGYLNTAADKTGIDTDTDTFNDFDMRIRKRAKEELTNKALEDLDARSKIETSNVMSIQADLSASKQKLQELVKFINTAKKELENLTQSDADLDEDGFKDDLVYKTENNLIDLFKKYKEVCEDLKQEKALKAVLDSNSDIDALEKQLITLLDGFTSIDGSRQELLTKLEELKEITEANANNLNEKTLRKGDILDDFDIIADASYDDLVENIKFASMRAVNTHYGEQLDNLAVDIESVLKSEEAINNSLSYLHAKKHEALLNQIKSLVEIYTNSLDDTVNDAVELCNGDTNAEGNTEVNYPALYSTLNTLKDSVSNIDLGLLLARIESTAEAGLYTELAENVDALKALLETHGIGDKLVNDIEAVLTSIQSRPAGPFDQGVYDNILTIEDSIEEYYLDLLKETLNNIVQTIEDLSETYSTAKEYLDDLKDEQVALLLSRVTTITETASTQLKIVELFGDADDFNIKTDYKKLPYGEEAVLATWPAYMRKKIISAADQWYSDIRKAVNDIPDAPGSFDDLEMSERRILRVAANLEAYKGLFDAAVSLAYQDTQSNERKDLVADLSNLILPTDALSTALNNLPDLVDRNAVLGQIITKLQATESVIEKQQLVNALKEELIIIIDLDTQLVEISAKLLCPSILLFEKEYPYMLSDSFYSEVKKFVLGDATEDDNTGVRTELLNISTEPPAEGSAPFTTKLKELLSSLGTIYNVVNPILTELATGDIAKYIQDSESLDTDSLLSQDYINTLDALKRALDTKKVIADLKDCKLFEILTKKDLSTAWQDGSRWLDGSGNAYTGTFEVDVKRDSTGKWTYNNGDDIDLEVSDIDTVANQFKLKDATFTDKGITDILNTLLTAVSKLGQVIIPAEFKTAYSIIVTEDQLLSDIRAIDKNRDFYYNVPIESAFAIDFNGSSVASNTLMNPAVNYDINNVNNNFVISKIDIDYLTDGLQIARSSRIS